jgi:hypothetical protein
MLSVAEDERQHDEKDGSGQGRHAPEVKRLRFPAVMNRQKSECRDDDDGSNRQIDQKDWSPACIEQVRRDEDTS